MTTPAVSVTVFNPPEEKKTKKAGGSLMVDREEYGIGSLVGKLRPMYRKIVKELSTDNAKGAGVTFSKQELNEYDPEDLIDSYADLKAFKDSQDSKANELIDSGVKPSSVKKILDRSVLNEDLTEGERSIRNKFKDKYFPQKEEAVKGQLDSEKRNPLLIEFGQDREPRAGGSLMVPREGYGVGSIVRALSKNVLSSKKRWNKLSSKEQENIEKKFYDNLEPDSVDPKVVDKISDQEFDDVMINTVKLLDAEQEVLEEKFKGSFSNKTLSDLNKSQLDYLFANKDKVKETKVKLDSVKYAGEEDIPFNGGGKADGSLLVPLEGGQIFAPNRKGNQKSYDEKAFTEQKAKATDDNRKLAGDLTDAETKQYAEKVSKKQKEEENFKRMQKAAQPNQNLAEGGMPEEQDMPVDTYPNIPPEEMAAAEASQLPDNEMEDQYIDFILDESLNPEEQTYLMNSLEADPQLSVIFDKLIGTASEFSGAGEVEGPGTGVSDSIPARLSDGEFVMTRKATDAIGADNLQTMMDDAERAYDGGYMMKAFGGAVEDEELEDSKSTNYQSKTDEEIRKVMIGSNRMPSVR